MLIFRRFPIRYVRSFTERKQEQELKKQKEQFRLMMDDLSKKEIYTLKDFKKELFTQDRKERNFFRKLFTEAQPEEIELEKQKKILSSFKDEELVMNEKISGEAKSEVAQVAQVNTSDVNELLRHFNMQKKLHSYLKSRRERGEYIPQTREELEIMMRTDRPDSSKEDFFNQKRKYSNKQKYWIASQR
ncbi:hypothetical protein SteCoe_13488 [Stentor coeruleus]|uniref:Uncharacterized protein n=1 Tax=Stentor coeruleus TaxID=5963 RepID=A0A1R2C8D6_9CILI|nr:hypothetical protein SteCoe_13488 [Stentor coeruleus]